MNQSLSSLSVAQLRQAIAIREKMEELEKELASILGGAPRSGAPAPVTGKKRTMSASARAKIGAAQKARWAAKRKAKPAAVSSRGAVSPKPVRKMSAAGRRRLSELAKARWAKALAAGKSSLKAA